MQSPVSGNTAVTPGTNQAQLQGVASLMNVAGSEKEDRFG
jgi:hypothetical protein